MKDEENVRTDYNREAICCNTTEDCAEGLQAAAREIPE